MNTYRIIFADGTYTDIEAKSVAVAVAKTTFPGGHKTVAVIDHEILEADINHDAFLALNRFVWGS